MSETLVTYKGNGVQLSDEEVKLLVSSNIIPKDTPKDVISLFGKVCNEKQLSPFSKQIHLIPRKDWNSGQTRYTFQTSIDGYRTIAERTGVYAGNDDYRFDNGKTEYDLLRDNIKQPITATATVHKIVGGVRCPFSATARWEEYFPGEKMGFMWKKMPFLMLGKCAEALALRKAFPEALGGLYTDDEMKQADKIKEIEIIENPAEVLRDFQEETKGFTKIKEIEDWWKTLNGGEKKLAYNLKESLKLNLADVDRLIKNLKKSNYDKDSYTISSIIDVEKDSERKGQLIESYNAKLKELGIEEEYISKPFDKLFS